HRRARSPATPARGPGERADQVGWHPHLLHLLARTGGRGRDHPRSPRSQPQPTPPADLGGRSPPSPRVADGGRRPAGASPSPSPPRFAHGRPRPLLPPPPPHGFSG